MRARLHNAAHARLLDALLDFSDSGQALEKPSLAATLGQLGLAPPSVAEFAGMGLPVTRGESGVAEAEAALEVMIRYLVEVPELEAGIAAATERFDMDEQTRLRSRKEEVERQYGALTRL